MRATLSAAALLAVADADVSFSAGFTDDMILQRAPSRAAVYGLVEAGSQVTVTVASATGESYTVQAESAAAGAGSTGQCSQKCVDSNHLCRGSNSCDGNPSCDMGCLWSARTSSVDTCKDKCDAAKAAGCTFTDDHQTFSLCNGCPAAGGGASNIQECYDGCAYGNPAEKLVGWKAFLLAAPAGGDYEVTAATASGSSSVAMQRITFGDVFVCSGQVIGALKSTRGASH